MENLWRLVIQHIFGGQYLECEMIARPGRLSEDVQPDRTIIRSSSVPLSTSSSLILTLHTVGTIARSRVAGITFRSRSKPTDEDYSISQNSIFTVLNVQRSTTIKHQTQRRRVPYKEPRLWQETHILSLPPTARLVSGVSAAPAVPRSTTLRRWLEIAPGLLAVDAP